jgi:hypothetical protein
MLPKYKSILLSVRTHYECNKKARLSQIVEVHRSCRVKAHRRVRIQTLQSEPAREMEPPREVNPESVTVDWQDHGYWASVTVR